jgi:hypothetical protein
MSETNKIAEVLAERSAARSNRRRFLAQAGMAGIGALTIGQLDAQAQISTLGSNNNKIDTF